MTDPAPWSCVCGESGHGETSAQRHAKTCGRMGWPRTKPDVEGER